ncbi:MAG: hypothetical protein ACLP4W_17510 [Mycobacterium sp.]|uniref:hypothetical protein n=1 Tax=Mycobacterium sp. TaxID=1785 RepID=UPI003F9AF2C8
MAADATTVYQPWAVRYEGHELDAPLSPRGGMGEVWRAYDTATNNRTVAIKLLPPQVAADHAFVALFRREADAADSPLRDPSAT